MATPRAAAKRSGSSNGKWLFTGMDQIHATIPLEILKRVKAFCEVGHTWSVVVEMRGTQWLLFAGLTTSILPSS
jgi:hypothetical protein